MKRLPCRRLYSLRLSWAVCSIVVLATTAAVADEPALVIYPREFWRLENNEKIVGEGGRLVTVEDAQGDEIEVVQYQPPRTAQREKAILLFTSVKPKNPTPKLLERKFKVWANNTYQETVFKEVDEVDRTIYRRGSEALDIRVGGLFETAVLNASIARLGWALDQLIAAKLLDPKDLPRAAAAVHGQREYLKLRQWLLAQEQDQLATRGTIHNLERIAALREEIVARQKELPELQKKQQALVAEIAELDKKLAGRTGPKGDPDLRRRDIAQIEEYESRADVLWAEQQIAKLTARIKHTSLFAAELAKSELGLDPATTAEQLAEKFSSPTPEQIARLVELMNKRLAAQTETAKTLPDVAAVLAQAAQDVVKIYADVRTGKDEAADPLKTLLTHYKSAYGEVDPPADIKAQLEAWNKRVATLPTVEFGRYRVTFSSKLEGIPNCLGTAVNVEIGGVKRSFYSYQWPDAENFHDLVFDIELRESDEEMLPLKRPEPSASINAYCPNLDFYNTMRLKGWSFSDQTTFTRMAENMFASDKKPTEIAGGLVTARYKARGTLDVSIELARTKRHEERGMGSPDASLDSLLVDSIKIERYEEPKLVLRQVMVQKNLIKPGEENRAVAWVHNRTDEPQTGEFKLFWIHGFNDYKLLVKQEITVEPQSFAHLAFAVPLPADAPLFGHEVRAELFIDGRRTVATDPFSIHPNCFHVFLLGGATADHVYRTPKDFCNHKENFGVTFNDSVELLPDNKLVPYVRGMPSAPALGHIPMCRAEGQRNHQLGVAMVHYLSPLCTGHRSYYHYLRNPEWWPVRLLWTDQMNDNYIGGSKLIEEQYLQNVPIDGGAVGKQFPMLHLEQPLNHVHPLLFNNLVEDLITYSSLVDWDGTRWDGGPITVFTRDFLGRPVKHPKTGELLESQEDVRQTCADLFHELKTRMRAAHPQWVYGNNGDSEGYGPTLLTLEKDPPDVKNFPHYREFMESGGSYMDEGWMSAYSFQDARNKVEHYLKIGFKQSMEMKRHGGILQTFSPEREGTPSFHVDKIYYTLLPHLCGATYYGQLSPSPWSEDGPVYFFTRFGQFFFDPALRPYPEAESRINVDAADTWSHEAATWNKISDDHVQVIVPIISKHPRERIYDNLNRYSELPTPVTDEFTVSVAAPEGFEDVQPAVWQLTCEPRTKATRLKADSSGGTVEFQVPGLNLFKVIVLDFQRSAN